ncbi:ubiquitin-conjugating enzyme E2 R2-like, partial [Neolamprologus brichardi]|uniref:ubiquitin-conjugating enzyme E2 R2-like n=1 Tax=Neolamprologus brichardi TaxID=32507 RepID=UPI0003EC5FF1
SSPSFPPSPSLPLFVRVCLSLHFCTLLLPALSVSCLVLPPSLLLSAPFPSPHPVLPSTILITRSTVGLSLRTILLSVISLLNEPNTFSPANVDASVMYRKWRDSKGKDREYIEIIRKQVVATKADAERDGVKVPVTLDEYCVRTQVPPTDDGSNLLYDDYYDDEELDDDDDEDDDEDCCYDEDDSGTEDS